MSVWSGIKTGLIIAGVAGAIGSCTYVTIKEDIAKSRISTKLDRVKEISGIVANKDNDNYFSLDEKLEMWKDMGWYMEEYITGGGQKEYKIVRPGMPKDKQTHEVNQWKIDKYEQYISENGYDFEYTYENGYTFTKEPEKSDLRN